MTCFSRICVTGETGYSVLITFASSSNVAYPRVVRHWRNRSSDFHRLCSSFVRRHSRSCGLVARESFFCLQRGSGRLIKSNVAPKLCDTRHIFLCSPGADGSKNNCDFAGFDLNGDLHNKSSHAPVKTAIIIQLYFKTTACIFCKLCYLFIGLGFPDPCFALSNSLFGGGQEGVVLLVLKSHNPLIFTVI